MTNVWPVMMTGYYTMVSIWFVPNATVGNKDITTMYPQFKCNGCQRNTEFLWLEQLDTPEGFKAYQYVVRTNPTDNTQTDVLGVVGERYHVLQNEDLFSFGDNILDGGGRWETAGQGLCWLRSRPRKAYP